VWLCALAGCASQHGSHRSDEADTEVAPKPDATPVDSLSELLRKVFTEMQRDAELRCACYVAAGDYASQEACLEEVGRSVRSLQCLQKGLGDLQDEELRASMTCMLEERSTTNACLETASCDDQLTRCYAAPLGCPTFDPALLTRVASECPGAIGLSH
jgi:hypothetical protein